MMMRRVVPFFAMLALLASSVPLPARALSTQAEIMMGREQDEQIVTSNVIETDPLLNAYVQSVADKLWKQVERKDLPYSIKIIKGTDVNAFSTEGGYVYVYEGLLDFVQSDDELASVIGHETGHIERRHAVTLQAKAQALNLLLGIASFMSPLIYQFGNLIEAGGIAKMQREDELQADRYGLQLISRAGYDPDAMVTMMQHLEVLQNEKADIVTKYLQSHPDPGPRIAHLMGYPELDPKVVTEQQRLVQAASDEERARYEYSSIKLQQILKTDPTNSEALLDLGQDDLALGLTSKSEQTLNEASQIGPAAARAQAVERIAALRQMEVQSVSLVRPDLQGLRVSMQQAQATQSSAAVQIQARRDEARDQLRAVKARLDALQYEAPNMGNVTVRPGSRTEAILKNLTAMGRSLNSALSDAGTTIGGVGSLQRNKEGGLLKQSADILTEMQAPLNTNPIPPDSLEILPSYPSMLSDLDAADGEMLRAVDASRASLTMLDQSIGDVDAFLKQLQEALQNTDFSGDVTPTDYNGLVPLMQKALTGVNAAATAASQADQLYNMARTRQLSTRITLLGLGTSPQRYSTLQYALQQRFGLNGIDYTTMLHDGVTPGDVTVATILAADIKSTPQSLLDEAKRTHTSIVDVADAHGMHAWPLEIFTGLVYLDYTDDPQKEMHPDS
ncbi:MAG: M48 family metalloprotease [Vulcanimicrobiaceae bacterium]